METLLKIEEVAEYLKMHKITVYRLIKDNGLPGIKIGGEWRFRESDLVKWMDRNTKGGKYGR